VSDLFSPVTRKDTSALNEVLLESFITGKKSEVEPLKIKTGELKFTLCDCFCKSAEASSLPTPVIFSLNPLLMVLSHITVPLEAR